ncbi:MAG: thiamine pyrophosphate-dependent enzyme [Elusimicrobiota bacterium]
MDTDDYKAENSDIAWCPGCGNFGILNILKNTLAGLKIPPRDLAMVSGIGQAAKAPQYLKCNYFNGLHGRAVPVATGVKSANPRLTVIAESGDGCMYGEGGNHFLHAVRRNPDITLIVHNNMVYGLTKGQASPTSQKGFKTPVQLNGVFEEPFNPLGVAIAQNISFAARAYCKDMDETTDILSQAVEHKGLSLVDIFQPCVSFNKLNTYKWFKEHTYYLPDDYKPDNREDAFSRSMEKDKFPLGVFYKKERETFENQAIPESFSQPVYKQTVNRDKIEKLIANARE